MTVPPRGPAAARELLTINDAAARAQVNRRTIYNWMRDRRVEYIRTASGGVRIYADTLWRGADGMPLPLPLSGGGV